MAAFFRLRSLSCGFQSAFGKARTLFELEILHRTYCSERDSPIPMNVPEQQTLKNSILAIQSAATLDDYCSALDRLCKRFQFEGLRKYIVDIDPLNWCVFANRLTDCGYLLFRGQLINDSEWCSTGKRSAPSIDDSNPTLDGEDYIEEAYLLKEGARPSPLFDVRDTNVVEGENFASMQNDARNSVPLLALQIYVLRMTTQF